MISIVIPVHNEVESLESLYAEIDDVARTQGYDLEIIFVDDGSTDNSWRSIQQLAATDSRVHGIRLRRNFGKACALSAGFDAAAGEIVFTMDSDLQDDPREIPRFLEHLGDRYDVVSGWKQVRHDPWHKVLPSRVFNWAVSFLTGVQLHDHNCGFKCYRREIFDEIRLYGELHRFVPVLASSRGYRVGEITVGHRQRKFGHSKYGVGRLPKGFLDLMTVKFLTGFGQRPQHALGTLGLGFFSLGIFGIVVLTGFWFLTRPPFDWFDEPVHLTDRAIFFYSIIALFLGCQLLSLGFLAELMASYVAHDRQPYSIAEQTDKSKPPISDSRSS